MVSHIDFKSAKNPDYPCRNWKDMEFRNCKTCKKRIQRIKQTVTRSVIRV